MKTEMSFYLTNINHHIDARVVVVAIKVTLGLLKRIKSNPSNKLPIPHHLKERLSIGILLHLLVLIRLLVGRLRPPKFGHTQHGHCETRCAHRSEFLCGARDLGVGDAAEYGAGGIGVVRIRKSLSSPRILPVLGDGG